MNRILICGAALLALSPAPLLAQIPPKPAASAEGFCPGGGEARTCLPPPAVPLSQAQLEALLTAYVAGEQRIAALVKPHIEKRDCARVAAIGREQKRPDLAAVYERKCNAAR